MGKIVKNGITYGGKSTSAGNISYDNTTSELQSQTVQNAITELKDLVDENTGNDVGRFEKDNQGNITGEIFNTYSGNNKNIASGQGTHAEGRATTASGDYSHAEGRETKATKECCHAEGIATTASGQFSHAEGYATYAFGSCSHAEGYNTAASGSYSHAGGKNTIASAEASTAIGKFNVEDGTGANAPKHLFIIGNGTSDNARSNILEVNSTELNVNGDIQKNGVSLPTPYTTMPTITESMLGQIAMYVGETTNDYVKGYFYIASSDGAAEPTYSWVSMVDDAPTSGSKNLVTSGAVYNRTPLRRGTGYYSALGYDSNSSAVGSYSFSFGRYALAQRAYSVAIGNLITSNSEGLFAIGRCNSSKNGDLFEIGNGSSGSNRSNILEVNQTSMNVNGDIQRYGVGIDDYTTTERKIGKWIDGSDLYQRTFEVTELSKNTWNNSILDTSDIKIVDFTGLIYWLDNQAASDSTPLNYYASGSDNCFTCINTVQTDMRIYPTNTSSDMSIDKAIITIKYTKPSAQANLMQTTPTEEISETPTVEEDDMR